MTIWKTKLATWLHDPAEKALVLLRDKTGHEWGTVAELRESILGSRDLPADLKPLVRRADWYASAADRPQWPRDADQHRFARWTQVDFAEKPQLIHPLTGEPTDLLGKLTEIPVEELKQLSRGHFERLAQPFESISDESARHKKILLAFWRFGPEPPETGQSPLALGQLWRNLPADTRVPDHSIWRHLDLASALAGAMAADTSGTPALLAVSFGPVQGFIAEARTTSDLWAGSHLLARIAWEGMQVVCDRLGPDAVLFPQLRGVPLVDVWLRDKRKLPDEWFQQEEWSKRRSDANPLFSAALPNRFVAIVPADQVSELAQDIEERVRDFVATLGERSLARILKEVGESDSESLPPPEGLPCVGQLAEQLRGFPEVHWAAVSWSLAEGTERDAKRPADDTGLREALAGFYPRGSKLGFLDHEWQVLEHSGGIELEGVRFFEPNPGALYPALYELLDRVAAAAKAARPFDQLKQEGYRSTLNGEREWLTLADEIPPALRPGDLPEGARYLDLPPGRRGGDPGQVPTLWTRLAEKRPSWVKPGEHLDALGSVKRLWPTLFTEEVRQIVGEDLKRYMVSTHTFALAVSLERLLEGGDAHAQALIKLGAQTTNPELGAAALPKRLALKADREGGDRGRIARRLPALLERCREADDEEGLRCLEQTIQEALGGKPEAYYGLLLMDGDRMGAWLSGSTWKGDDGSTVDPRIAYERSWHRQIRASDTLRDLRGRHPALEAYLREKRPPSPARHCAISEALNHFSLLTVRFVVEDCFKGKLVYAGGDDVLAFVCVDDLLPAMTLLRHLYSGSPIPQWLTDRLGSAEQKRFDSNNGWLRLDKRLLMTMGHKATASCGAVVAHHQAPLGMVLRTLREAESAAKNQGVRDAFSLRVLKRAGGEIGVTDKWSRGSDSDAPGLLSRIMDQLSQKGVSRRAAYHSLNWLEQLPPCPDARLLGENLAYQFARQTQDGTLKKAMRALALDLADYVSRQHPEKPVEVLWNLLTTGEFLARESRHGFRDQDPDATKKEVA
jgi:CRISPR-associated protein Cmr2